MNGADRNDRSIVLRVARDLYWRIGRAATRAGFDSVQAFIHVVLEAYLDGEPR